MPVESINAKLSQARVSDVLSAFLSGIDATHNAYQSIVGVPNFVTLAGAYPIITSSGPGAILTTKGDVLTHDGTSAVRKAVGSNRAVFIGDSAQTTGNRWGNDPILNGAAIDNSIIGGTTPAAGTFTSVKVAGTAGAGYYEAVAQSSAPAAPASGFRLYPDSTHRFSWIGQNGFVTKLDSVGNSADRVYTLPNVSGNVILDTSTPVNFTPTANSTASFGAKNQAGTNWGLVYDSINQRVGINPLTSDSLTKGFEIFYKDFRFTQIAAPGAPTAALAGLGAGNIDNGDHKYRVTFITANGETDFGTASSTVTVANNAVNGQIALSAIPTAAAGLQVTARNIYRTKVGDTTTVYLLTTINDNTTTVFNDNVADASLGATGFNGTQSDNSTAGSLWIGATRVGIARANNSAWGGGALGSLTSGLQNAALGANALAAVTTGINNIGIGFSAGTAITTGITNLAIGTNSLLALISGSNNTSVGVSSGRSITSSRNVFIGTNSGWTSGSTPSSSNAVTTGADNTYIGYQAGQESSTQRSFAMAFGSGASVNASNTAAIGGTTTANAVDITSGRVTASAKLDLLKPTASTSGTIDLLWLGAHSTGTPAATFGVGFKMLADTNGAVDQPLFYAQAIWNDATNSTRKAEMPFQIFDTVGREFMRAKASGSAAMIAFLGATPIVQEANTVALDTLTVDYGLRASGGNANFDTMVQGTLGVEVNRAPANSGLIQANYSEVVAADFELPAGVVWEIDVDGILEIL